MSPGFKDSPGFSAQTLVLVPEFQGFPRILGSDLVLVPEFGGFPRISGSDLVLVSRISRFPSSPGLKKQDRAAHALANAAAAGARPKNKSPKLDRSLQERGGAAIWKRGWSENPFCFKRNAFPPVLENDDSYQVTIEILPQTPFRDLQKVLQRTHHRRKIL